MGLRWWWRVLGRVFEGDRVGRRDVRKDIFWWGGWVSWLVCGKMERRM